MRVVPILRDRVIDEHGDLTELILWRVPQSTRHPAGIRYRLAFIPAGMKRPAVLYDNHHPKGHTAIEERRRSRISLRPLINCWGISSLMSADLRRSEGGKDHEGANPDSEPRRKLQRIPEDLEGA